MLPVHNGDSLRRSAPVEKRVKSLVIVLVAGLFVLLGTAGYYGYYLPTASSDILSDEENGSVDFDAAAIGHGAGASLDIADTDGTNGRGGKKDDNVPLEPLSEADIAAKEAVQAKHGAEMEARRSKKERLMKGSEVRKHDKQHDDRKPFFDPPEHRSRDKRSRQNGKRPQHGAPTGDMLLDRSRPGDGKTEFWGGRGGKRDRHLDKHRKNSDAKRQAQEAREAARRSRDARKGPKPGAVEEGTGAGASAATAAGGAADEVAASNNNAAEGAGASDGATRGEGAVEGLWAKQRRIIDEKTAKGETVEYQDKLLKKRQRASEKRNGQLEEAVREAQRSSGLDVPKTPEESANASGEEGEDADGNKVTDTGDDDDTEEGDDGDDDVEKEKHGAGVADDVDPDEDDRDDDYDDGPDDDTFETEV